MLKPILIPVSRSDDVIEVDAGELPEDTEEVIEILRAELAPPALWLRFAIAYYQQGKLFSFEQMLMPLIELHQAAAPTVCHSALTVLIVFTLLFPPHIPRVHTPSHHAHHYS